MPLVPYIYKHSSAHSVLALYRAADNQWKQLVILPGRTGREMASQERRRLNSPIAATGRGHLTQDRPPAYAASNASAAIQLTHDRVPGQNLRQYLRLAARRIIDVQGYTIAAILP